MHFVQDGQPLLVWGTGRHEVNPDGKTPLERNNYYYSFTRLAASGTIAIGGQDYPVEGLTWMDHEYGWFGKGTNWVLQDAQLDNGVHLSTFAVDATPQVGVPYDSWVSILWPDGDTTFHKSVTTPQGPTWTSPEGVDYCLTMEIAIEEPAARLIVTSLLADQEFEIQQSPIYEGIASVSGTFAGETVTGPGWLEQKIKLGGKADAALAAIIPRPG
jgi:predicted secreted hydrolase